MASFQGLLADKILKMCLVTQKETDQTDTSTSWVRPVLSEENDLNSA